MASTQTSLDAAAQERKMRLAKLKSLKRKQPENEDLEDVQQSDEISANKSESTSYLSGRNYDAATRGPKLGFETAPNAGQETLEKQAQSLSIEAKKHAEEEEKIDQPVDLFKLQPKKPNWDLKRDMERKLEKLNVQTDNAIARIVRERIASQKKQKAGETSQTSKGGEDGEGDAVGLEGQELVGAMHQREREGEESSVSSEEDG
jgi:coiled-coil domain-containing protein 12